MLFSMYYFSTLYLFFLFLFLPGLTNSQKCPIVVYPDVKSEIDALSVPLNDSYYYNVISNTMIVLENYVYKDILKSPPEILGQPEYFTKVDIDTELHELYNRIKSNLTDTYPFYVFHQNLMEIIRKMKDFHLQFSFVGGLEKTECNKLFKLIVNPPVTFTIKQIQGKKKVYAKPNNNALACDLEIYYKNFNMSIVQDKLAKGIELISINDMDPITYIEQFGERFHIFKNKNAEFTYKQTLFSGFFLKDLPLDLEDLTTFKLTYSDETVIDTNFIFFTKQTIPNEESFFDFMENKNPLYKQNHLTPINQEEYLKEYFKKYPQKNYNNLTFTEGNITWDFQSKDGTFKCREDNINKVNVYLQSSFSPDSVSSEFLNNFLKQCVLKFDNNTYPIIVIENYNGGGSATFSEIFQESIQPHSNAQAYYSIRISSDPIVTKRILVSENIHTWYWKDTHERLYEPDELNEFFNDQIEERISEEIIHKRIKQKYLLTNDKIPFTIQLKELIKNPRKPTDIIIFTDGYSYSATSIFLKGIYNLGGAIIVGFNGNPNSDADTFDISQSSTIVYNGYVHMKQAIPAIAELERNGYQVSQISFAELFRTKPKQNLNKSNDYEIPEEFTFCPADERVPIYEPYTDSAYDLFIKYALQIHLDYKIKCNPKNERLKLLNDKHCKEIGTKHRHGGFLCSEDGLWSNECGASYCDKDYYFDLETKECIKDEIFQIFTNKQNEGLIKELTKQTEDLNKKIEDMDKNITTLVSENKKLNKLYEQCLLDKNKLKSDIRDKYVPYMITISIIIVVLLAIITAYVFYKRGYLFKRGSGQALAELESQGI